jgi:hypothetical protein
MTDGGVTALTAAHTAATAEVPDAFMSDGDVNTLTTTQSPTTGADTHGNESATFKVAPTTTTKPPHTPVPPREQAQPLITPAPSPWANLAITDPPSTDGAEKHGCSAPASSSVTPPKFSWPTPMELDCTDEAAFALLRDTAERIPWNTTMVG